MAPTQPRRGAVAGTSQRVSSRNWRIHVVIWTVIILISVVGPSYFLTERAGKFLTGQPNSLDGSSDEFQVEERRRRIAMMQMGDVQLAKEKPVHGDLTGISPLQGTDEKDAVNVSIIDEDKVVSLLDPSKSQSEGQIYDDNKSRVQDAEQIALEDSSRAYQQETVEFKKMESEAVGKASVVDYVWRRGLQPPNSDHNVRIMRDQLMMARAFSSMDGIPRDSRLVRDLKYRLKENLKALEDVTYDSELPRGSEDKMKAMARLLSKVRDLRYDDKVLVKRLKSMLETSEYQLHHHKKQSNFLSQLAAKTVPKSLHCLSMRLTVSYNGFRPEEKDFPATPELEDNSLFHYAIFSDNVLAVSVVVNSTVVNAKEPEKHVFHIVTDTLNYGAMVMWFRANPPGRATIQVQNVDTFQWLNSSYSPVLKQLETESMKAYFFKSDKERVSANLKYRNPKYLSMLNHLRFYLPEMFPTLDKILFLDDDVVVMKDLTPLWSVDLKAKVNGAVETCGKTFHRFDRYLNFSNPHIRRNFSPRDCGWAYGMNIFDLKEWKKRDITGIYHKWQNLNANRTLWKLGTLPPGLITFYNLTHPLSKSWHVLGLGYNPDTDVKAIEAAAVVHYNGNMKPWLEIGISKFKPYWSKYIKYDHPWLQQCNFISD
ncbi:hypothetical protein KC19_2G114800 [Ceratodon purpureus]|uniref:Hexosyltransferase n=1 Tax=Ceratodon purpureus TaxID=3225 RepID=A0A8T0IVP9_CERPU|nr:hypothetical protein KC19_2G114800 [Ceratodon purpureus]